MNENQTSQEVLDTAALKSMVRDELAAVEMYNKAIRSIHSAAIVANLERIRDEHQVAICMLRRFVRDASEASAPASGAWGVFASATAGRASVVGDAVVLAALKRGEQHGEAAYRAGMGNPDLPDAFRFLVGSQLLPRCQEHLERLKELSCSDALAQ